MGGERDKETEQEISRESVKGGEKDITNSISSLRKLTKNEIQQPNDDRGRYCGFEEPKK